MKALLLLLLCLPGIAQTAPTATPNAGTIYKTASPAVVLIEAYDDKGEVASAGSGFLVSQDGKILTNFHVIQHTKRATVRLANKDAYDTVEVLDLDKRKDIALIKIKAVELPYLTLGKSSAVDVGDQIFSLSTPLGIFQNTLSSGIVSGIRAGDGYKYFQITAPISHGSSGSPVFNSHGEVIGIATMTFSEGQNLNFAVPVDYAKGMLSDSPKPKSLSETYEPEAAPEPPISSAKASSPVTPDIESEIKASGMFSFLEKRINAWSYDDAIKVLGKPTGHRFGLATPVPDIYAFDDPTKAFRQYELLFSAASHKVENVYAYPWNTTLEDCKRLWGDDYKTIKNPNGTRYYSYKHRHLGVLVAPNGTVVNIGVY